MNNDNKIYHRVWINDNIDDDRLEYSINTDNKEIVDYNSDLWKIYRFDEEPSNKPYKRTYVKQKNAI